MIHVTRMLANSTTSIYCPEDDPQSLYILLYFFCAVTLAGLCQFYFVKCQLRKKVQFEFNVCSFDFISS